jgi:3-hydroxyacyl-[acyl-carrier-protein] dehydratase
MNIPHKYPFLMIDRVIERDDKTITCIKNVSNNEPQMQGHFPGNPVFPGVLMIESMAQASALLALGDNEYNEDSQLFLVAVDKVRFKKPVVPGDQLIVKSELTFKMANILKFECSILVDDLIIATAIMSCAIT